jgi:hypothetical protein
VIEGCEINDSPYAPGVRLLRVARLAEMATTCRSAGSAGGPVRREARHPRHGRGRPDRRRRPDPGGGGPLPLRRAGHPLRTGPRTHRGIFSINELPDLPPRIQVSLLNILEERDIQIRGSPSGSRSTCCSWPPPTRRTTRTGVGSSPRSRTGSGPRCAPTTRSTACDEIDIMRQEAKAVGGRVRVTVPDFLEDVIAEFTHQIRGSGHVNQRSGVSVRLSIANLETLVASAVRRAVRTGSTEAVPRISDLGAHPVVDGSGRVRRVRGGPRGGDPPAPARPGGARGVPRASRRVSTSRRSSRRSMPVAEWRWAT